MGDKDQRKAKSEGGQKSGGMIDEDRLSHRRALPFPGRQGAGRRLEDRQDFNPDILPAGSDGLDFYKLSRFDRDPQRMKQTTMQSEIMMWQKAQREWNDAAPNARRQFIPGNHEERWDKTHLEARSIPELLTFLLPKVLRLKELGIEENMCEEIDLGRTGHPPRAGRPAALWSSARGEVEKQRYQVSTMTGHTHRGGIYMTTTRQGIIYGVECFCLCKLDPWYGHGPYDWQHGIVLATIHKDKILSSKPSPSPRSTEKWWRTGERKNT